MPVCLLSWLALLLVGGPQPSAPRFAESDARTDHAILREAESAFDDALRLRDRPAEARPLFRQAADRYAALHERGLRSPGLYLSQGNAFFLANELPQAMLAYRRGLRLDPNDRDLRRNLETARAQVVYPASSELGRQPLDHWPPWLPRPTTGFFVVLAAVLGALGWLGLTRWRMTRRTGFLWFGILAFAAAALPAGGWGIMSWQHAEARRNPLVVIAGDRVHVSKGNGVAYPLRYAEPLNRGVEGRLRFDRGDWLQIELAGGEVGWVPRSAVLIDADFKSNERPVDCR
jgi:hypothetical protein